MMVMFCHTSLDTFKYTIYPRTRRDRANIGCRRTGDEPTWYYTEWLCL